MDIWGNFNANGHQINARLCDYATILQNENRESLIKSKIQQQCKISTLRPKIQFESILVWILLLKRDFLKNQKDSYLIEKLPENIS